MILYGTATLVVVDGSDETESATHHIYVDDEHDDLN